MPLTHDEEMALIERIRGRMNSYEEMLEAIFKAASQPGDTFLFNTIKHAEKVYREGESS